MLDIKFIRENIPSVKEALEVKGVSFDIEEFLSLDEKRRELIQKIDELRNKKNIANNQIKNILKKKKDPSSKIEEMRKVSKALDKIEADFRNIKNIHYFCPFNFRK